MTTSSEACMINAMIDMLNFKEHLPTYIIMIPDKGLVTWYGHFKYGISRIIQIDLAHMISEVEHPIRTRWENLLQTRPGVVNNKTKVIWVKMITRLYINTADGKGSIFAQTLADRGGLTIIHQVHEGCSFCSKQQNLTLYSRNHLLTEGVSPYPSST